MAKMSPFIISPYVAESTGQLIPCLPDCCPNGGQQDEACRISVHSWRDRKTGPRFPLAIIHCSTHRVFLTVYPPGFARYLRQPLIDVSPSGRRFSANDKRAEDAAGRPPSRFRGTKFEAAFDAASGVAWDREPYSSSGRWWQTQRLRLDECCRLLGLLCERDDVKVREVVAHILDVPQMVVDLERAKVAAVSSYRTRGTAVVVVLEKMSRICELERLTLAGHVAGLWGCPYWWDGDTGCLSPVPFQQPGTSFADLMGGSQMVQ